MRPTVAGSSALFFTLYAVGLQSVISQQPPSNDGHNAFKVLRDVGDGVLVEEEGQVPSFYRSPSFYIAPFLNEDRWNGHRELGVEKRAPNHYKNLMLSPNRGVSVEQDDSKPAAEDPIYHFPRVVVKRKPGSILTWALYSKHLPDHDHNPFFTPFAENLRLPIGDKSSAFVAKMGKRSADEVAHP